MTQPWPGYGRASLAMAHAAMARPWRGHGPAMARPLLGHGPQLATRNWRQRGVGRMRKAIEIRISSHRKNKASKVSKKLTGGKTRRCQDRPSTQNTQSIRKNRRGQEQEQPSQKPKACQIPNQPKHRKDQHIQTTMRAAYFPNIPKIKLSYQVFCLCYY